MSSDDAKRSLQKVIDDEKSSEEDREKARKALRALEGDDDDDKDSKKKLPVGKSRASLDQKVAKAKRAHVSTTIEARSRAAQPRLHELADRADRQTRSETAAQQVGNTLQMPVHISQADAAARLKELDAELAELERQS